MSGEGFSSRKSCTNSRPRDRRVAIPWCCQGEWGEAAQGVLGQLAKPDLGIWLEMGSFSLWPCLFSEMGVISYWASAERHTLETVVNKVGEIPSTVEKWKVPINLTTTVMVIVKG